MTTPPGNLQSLAAAKERAVKVIGDAFAADAFEMEELESRLARVYRAGSVAELDALLADLVPATPAPTTSPHAPGSIAAHTAAAPLIVRTLLSATRRAGHWIVPRRLEVRALLGDLTLDLRDAELPAGGCEIVVHAVLASVTILVRPGTPVDIDVGAVLASVEDESRLASRPDRTIPRVRVTGKATMASVEVKAPSPGLDAGD